MRAQMAAAAAAHRRAARDGHERYKALSRDRLGRIVRRKHTTTLIGALARFEEHVGRALWGHGKPDDARTPDELAWRAAWDRCRTEILNHGNAQLRALDKELAQYEVEWLRYRTDLPVVGAAGGGSIDRPTTEEQDNR